MNCHQSETLMLAARDCALDPVQGAALAEHVGNCASCRRLQASLDAGFARWKSETTLTSPPDASAAWRLLRAQLAEPAVRPRRRRPPLLWLAAPLAAAAALAFTFYRPTAPVIPAPGPMPIAEIARADFVEAGDATASTMVYVDKESGWLVVWASGPDNGSRG
jgi:hypothetical protein